MWIVLALAPVGDGFEEVARPFLNAHCVACHDASAGTDESLAGGLDLAGVTGADLERAPDDWDWLLERVEFEEMPPSGHPAPTEGDRAAFVTWLRDAIGDDGAGEVRPLPPIELRHWTALEYANAARDLFGVEVEVRGLLPEDAVGHGFDHVAAAQSLSVDDFETYLTAAELVASRAFPAAGEVERRVDRYTSGEITGGTVRGSVHWLYTRGAASARVRLASAGRYVVRAELFGSQAGDEPCRVVLQLGDGRSDEIFDVAGDAPTSANEVTAEFVVDAAGDTEARVVFTNDYFDKDHPNPARRDRNLAIRWIEVEGPFDPPASVTVTPEWVQRAEGAEGLDGTLRALARLVWRTPDVAPADVVALRGLTTDADDTSTRLRIATTAMLASSRFLFRHEYGVGAPDERGSVALRGEELATRLAGFLWRTVPDGELLDVAARGGLSDEDELVRVAKRMMRDPRCDESIAQFAEQWLQLRALPGHSVDRKAFPKFRGPLRKKMLEETRRVVLDSFRERRDLWELLDGNWTIVDETLGAHYGLALDADVEGWRRVDLSSTERRGLLGHASVLMVTSDSTRTSPVRRGKWVLDVLLGTPPPPPPPGADSLPEETADTAKLSLRERYAAHRVDPNCAACHERMDPLGFGLEAFDGVGAVRSVDDPARADLSGELPDGRTFEGPLELYALLRADDRFLDALIERMFVYALGRGLERADRTSLAAVRAALDPSHPTLEDIVLAIVRTPEFTRVAQPK